MYEALNKEKSHWFNFMQTMIEGCVVGHSRLTARTMRFINPECTNKAIKFSKVFLDFDDKLYKAC